MIELHDEDTFKGQRCCKLIIGKNQRMVMTECSSALRRNVAMLELPFRCHAESVLVEQSQLLLMTEEEPALLAAPLLLLLPGEQDDVVVVVADADDCDCPVGD
ncbi:hypothetical protein DERF_011039 [Dermatophagoides farinae]|uniref:Uncharacterized protein n=1 Tax=Dermatophagoides farinae TaxID=6954 RepID=A0A922HTU0_DERFA|nr:hypothetical protein DERF_011039 [Dermatophagoides farinae]